MARRCNVHRVRVSTEASCAASTPRPRSRCSPKRSLRRAPQHPFSKRRYPHYFVAEDERPVSTPTSNAALSNALVRSSTCRTPAIHASHATSTSCGIGVSLRVATSRATRAAILASGRLSVMPELYAVSGRVRRLACRDHGKQDSDFEIIPLPEKPGGPLANARFDVVARLRCAHPPPRFHLPLCVFNRAVHHIGSDQFSSFMRRDVEGRGGGCF